MSSDPEAIRARVRKLHQESGLSGREAAHKAGLGEVYVNHYIAGKIRQMTPDKAEALGRAYGVAPSFILFGDKSDPALAEVIDIWDHIDTDARRSLAGVARSLAKRSSDGPA